MDFWGRIQTPTCECGKLMEVYQYDSQFICEPPQVWVTWECSCGETKFIKYRDNYLTGEIDILNN